MGALGEPEPGSTGLGAGAGGRARGAVRAGAGRCLKLRRPHSGDSREGGSQQLFFWLHVEVRAPVPLDTLPPLLRPRPQGRHPGRAGTLHSRPACGRGTAGRGEGLGRSPGPGPWPGAAPRQTDGSGRGGRIGEGGVRWCRPGRTPASAEEVCWGPGPCASGGAACPLRRAGGRRGDTPSCHRRCPGLSRRAPAGRGGNARAGAAVFSQLRGARAGRQCACAAGAPRAGREARGPALVTPPARPYWPSHPPTGSHCVCATAPARRCPCGPGEPFTPHPGWG